MSKQFKKLSFVALTAFLLVKCILGLPHALAQDAAAIDINGESNRGSQGMSTAPLQPRIDDCNSLASMNFVVKGMADYLAPKYPDIKIYAEVSRISGALYTAYEDEVVRAEDTSAISEFFKITKMIGLLPKDHVKSIQMKRSDSFEPVSISTLQIVASLLTRRLNEVVKYGALTNILCQQDPATCNQLIQDAVAQRRVTQEALQNQQEITQQECQEENASEADCLNMLHNDFYNFYKENLGGFS